MTTATENTVQAEQPMNPVFEANKAVLADLAQKATELARQIKAQGNVEETVSDILKDSEDEQLVKFREYRDKLESQLYDLEEQAKTYVRENLLPKDADQLDVKAATEQYKVYNKQFKDLVGALSNLNLPGTEDFVNSITKPEPLRGSGTSNSQTGIVRKRIDRIRVKPVNAPDNEYQEAGVKTVKNDDGTETQKFSLGNLVEWFRKEGGGKVDANVLREHADAAANTTEWVSLNGKPFEFNVAVPDTDKSYMVEITPRPGKADSTDN